MRRTLCLLGACCLVSCAARGPQGGEPQAAAAPARASEAVLVRRPPRSSGALDGDAVGRALYAHRGELAACYDEVGGGRAGRGVVYALLDVGRDGAVRRADVGYTDVRDPRFERCVEGVMRGLPLPASGDLSLVQAHLVFGAESEEEGRALLAAYREGIQARETAARPDEPVTLAGLRGRIQPCYERALRRSPGLSGRTVLHIVLDEDGSVADAAFSSGDDLGDGLGRCVLGIVRSLRLSREDASVATLTYPVILGPGLR